MLFLTVTERIIIQKALSDYVKLSSREVDRFTSVFGCYGYNDIPKQLEITTNNCHCRKSLITRYQRTFRKTQGGCFGRDKEFFLNTFTFGHLYIVEKDTTNKTENYELFSNRVTISNE